MAEKPKTEQSKAYDRDTFNRLHGLARVVKKTAPPTDPKKGNKK
ncbi:hypothetical protein ABZX12_18485 [Kribbella sp. NPDC003505]